MEIRRQDGSSPSIRREWIEISPQCCEWCTKIAGRYVYGEEPRDVFRRHDNCGCTVTYENGKQRQDVWSKKSWEAPDIVDTQAAPVRFSGKQANDLEQKNLQYKGLTNNGESGIIKKASMLRYKNKSRTDIKTISDKRYEELTIEARKNGAIIMRGGVEVENHLDFMNADASTIGDLILFREDVCLSEVLEETHHFMQNKIGMNNEKEEPLKTYLNEIEAKEYLLKNAKKYKIPRSETELTKKQLEYYKKELQKFKEGHYE